MKKHIILAIFALSSTITTAQEQSFKISNNIDVSKFQADKEKYRQTMESIVNDVRENAIYSKIGPHKIKPHQINVYNFEISNVEVLLKNNVLKRNLQKADATFKSDTIITEVAHQFGYIKQNSQWFNKDGNYKFSEVCFVLSIKDKDQNNLIQPQRIKNSRSITIYDFIRPSSETYYHDPQSLVSLIDKGHDIPVANQKINAYLTLEEIANIDSISIKTENCKFRQHPMYGRQYNYP